MVTQQKHDTQHCTEAVPCRAFLQLQQPVVLGVQEDRLGFPENRGVQVGSYEGVSAVVRESVLRSQERWHQNCDPESRAALPPLSLSAPTLDPVMGKEAKRPSLLGRRNDLTKMTLTASWCCWCREAWDPEKLPGGEGSRTSLRPAPTCVCGLCSHLPSSASMPCLKYRPGLPQTLHSCPGLGQAPPKLQLRVRVDLPTPAFLPETTNPTVCSREQPTSPWSRQLWTTDRGLPRAKHGPYEALSLVACFPPLCSVLLMVPWEGPRSGFTHLSSHTQREATHSEP